MTEAKEWAKDWLIKRTLGEIDELINMAEDRDEEVNFRLARVKLLTARVYLRGIKTELLLGDEIPTTANLNVTDTKQFTDTAVKVEAIEPPAIPEPDFRGTWKTADGCVATVTHYEKRPYSKEAWWMGTIISDGKPITCSWDAEGRAAFPEEDLVERLRDWAVSQGR